MVLAHLRGLLRPDYKYGGVSRAAESLVLSALAAEHAAEQMRKDSEHTEALYAAIKDVGALRDMARKVNFDLLSAAYIARLDFSGAKKAPAPESEFDALKKLYYALEKAGFENFTTPYEDPEIIK